MVSSITWSSNLLFIIFIFLIYISLSSFILCSSLILDSNLSLLVVYSFYFLTFCSLSISSYLFSLVDKSPVYLSLNCILMLSFFSYSWFLVNYRSCFFIISSFCLFFSDNLSKSWPFLWISLDCFKFSSLAVIYSAFLSFRDFYNYVILSNRDFW